MKRSRTDALISLVIVLAAAAIAQTLVACQQSKVSRNKTANKEQQTNENPMKQMMQSMMSGVVTPGIKPDELPDPNSAGAELVAHYCAQCHNLPNPVMHAATEWPGIAERMFRRESMMAHMSGMGMMGQGGMMGGRGMMGGAGMMNIKAPTPEEQNTILSYLKKHALTSVTASAIPAPHTQGALLFAATCSRCHALPNPKTHTAAEWPGVVAQMKGFMQSMGKPVMTGSEEQKITVYLERNAKAH